MSTQTKLISIVTLEKQAVRNVPHLVRINVIFEKVAIVRLSHQKALIVCLAGCPVLQAGRNACDTLQHALGLRSSETVITKPLLLLF